MILFIWLKFLNYAPYLNLILFKIKKIKSSSRITVCRLYNRLIRISTRAAISKMDVKRREKIFSSFLVFPEMTVTGSAKKKKRGTMIRIIIERGKYTATTLDDESADTVSSFD